VAAIVDAVLAPVIMPAAETLPARQRTILEERALLSGLGGRAPLLGAIPENRRRRSALGRGRGVRPGWVEAAPPARQVARSRQAGDPVSAEKPSDRISVEVTIEPVTPQDPSRLSHLAQHRRLIVRRALLASALGGVVPVPIVDDIVSGRMRAGLYMKLAACRQVDLPRPRPVCLPRARPARLGGASRWPPVTLAALKLAWRKIFCLAG